jgi:hypothetical protein
MNDLVLGQVEHARTKSATRAHRFSYPWFGVVAKYPIQGLGRWFSHNRFGFLSFDDRDHGWRDGSNAMGWLQAELDAVGLTLRVGDLAIEVLTMPRVLSFVFNPVSFWYLRDASRELVAVVVEVNNTFDQTHSYVLHKGGRPIADGDWIDTSKQFFVSPFFKVSGYYRFSFQHHTGHTQVRLNHLDKDHTIMLATSIAGKRIAMSRGYVARYGSVALFRVWMTLLRIHLQAFRIWIKGVGLVPRDIEHGRPVKSNNSEQG